MIVHKSSVVHAFLSPHLQESVASRTCFISTDLHLPEFAHSWLRFFHVSTLRLVLPGFIQMVMGDFLCLFLGATVQFVCLAPYLNRLQVSKKPFLEAKLVIPWVFHT